ncbi:helix-turn-helix domain-containing protein [Salinispora tropica]|uniref:Helix-turn-helix domain protein n=1 Tax=Salinispora tropica (strain ATCC BAA-916 / DSM 44818 / JCM 13857 / NBRC 105044 / CNB-440) TaxID=369723 RepID=A4XD32_SALTO|nr:helix-turn-helix transcriptional regulator [Salinispora tropica]ABP56839.1 hypothetical protein Strop_4411 [Salinispora tropica CNB-440]
MRDTDDTRTARHALGRRLAELRRAAGQTQHGLARLVQYGRSSVANTETGRQHPERPFWTRCDEALRTGGVLTAEYDRIANRDHRHRAVQSRGRAGPPSDPPPRWWEAVDDTEGYSPAALVARLCLLRHDVDRAIVALTWLGYHPTATINHSGSPAETNEDWSATSS